MRNPSLNTFSFSFRAILVFQSHVLNLPFPSLRGLLRPPSPHVSPPLPSTSTNVTCDDTLTDRLWSPCGDLLYQQNSSEGQTGALFCQVVHAPDSHTGEVIRDMVLATLDDWGLEARSMVAITTDNASNNISACKMASKFDAEPVRLSNMRKLYHNVIPVLLSQNGAVYNASATAFTWRFRTR